MRVRLLGIVSVLFLIAAAIALLYSALPNAREPSSYGSDASTPHASGATPDAQAPTGVSESASADVAPADAPTAARTEAALEVALSEAIDELWIVDAATRAPIADATVHFADIPSDDYRAWFDWNAGLGPGCRRVESEGVALRSDAAGLVRVPKSKGYGVAVARKGELFGVWWIDERDAKPWTFALQPDRDWVVDVRDRNGRPIPGLAVWLRSSETRASLRDTSENVGRFITDAKGELRVEHAHRLLSYQKYDHFELRPEALLREPVVLAHEGREPPAARAEWVLPELGTVEVVLRTAAGAAWSGGHGPWGPDVRISDADRAPGGYFDSLDFGVRVGRDALGQLNAYAQVGTRVRARWNPGLLNGDVTALADGPRAAFERIEIPLVVGAANPILRIRVLDAADTPIAAQELELAFRSRDAGGAGGAGSGGRHTTNSAGLLELATGRPYPGFRTVLTLTHADGTPGEGRVVLPEPLVNGVVELGDVRLAVPRAMVAGSVVDATGAPLSNARVTVEGAPPPGERPSIDALLEAQRRTGVAEPTLAALRSHHEARLASDPFAGGPSWTIETDALGRFELRSVEPCERLRVKAQTDTLPESEWRDASVGITDVRIELGGSTVVTGRVLVPEFLALTEISVHVHRYPLASDNGRSFPQLDPELDSLGEWRCEGLAPGRWSVEVKDRNTFSWEPLAPPLQVELVAGREVRAADVDLRAILRKIDLRVVDALGQPVARASGTCRPPSGGEDSDIVVSAGRARIVTRHARLDAWLGFPGRRAVRAEDLQDGATITLADALPVRLRLRSLAALPAAPIRLEAAIDPGMGGSSYILGEITRSAARAFDADGSVLVDAAVVGKHSVLLRVSDSRTTDATGQPRWTFLRQEQATVIEVRESPDEQEFEIDVDTAALANALASLSTR